MSEAKAPEKIVLANPDIFFDQAVATNEQEQNYFLSLGFEPYAVISVFEEAKGPKLVGKSPTIVVQHWYKRARRVTPKTNEVPV